MTLTEEQREAIRAVSDLPRAIGCTRCHNYIQKNYSNQFAVLRSMIDNKDYVPNAAKLIELLAAGEHEQWADWAQSILDSEPGLSEGRKAAWPGMIATPYENLSDELKDKDRREVYLRSSVALDIVQQQAARIKELESSLDEAEALTKKNAELMNGYLGRIAELEDALVEERAGAIRCESYDHCEGMYRIDLPDAMIRAQQELQAEGKIGLDAAKPRSWQITEERVGLLEYCLETLLDAPDIEEIPGPGHSIEVLRAMLTEAGQ